MAASGANLAAIGYHFGSKENLLNEALMQAIGRWGDEMDRALAVEIDPEAGLLKRFEMTWTRVIESFITHRPLWVASFEVFAQIERAPEVRRFLANALQQGRQGLAMMFQGIDGTKDERSAWVVGSFYHALMSGLMVQWLTDPEHAPSSRDLTDALRMILAGIETTDVLEAPRPPDDKHNRVSADSPSSAGLYGCEQVGASRRRKRLRFADLGWETIFSPSSLTSPTGSDRNCV